MKLQSLANRMALASSMLLGLCASASWGQSFLQPERILAASDGGTNDQFGFVVEIGENDNSELVMAVAAFTSPNKVYLYDPLTGTETQVTGITPSIISIPLDAIAIGNGILAVGNPHDNANTGIVHLIDLQTGAQIGTLNAEAPFAEEYFGWSLEIENNLLFVGSPRPTLSTGGVVYIYDLNTLSLLSTIASDSPQQGDAFGWAIEVDEGIMIVGAPDEDNIINDDGAAYLFDVAAGTQIAKLFPVDVPPSLQSFGSTVAIDSGRAAVRSDQAVGDIFIFDAATGTEITRLTNPVLYPSMIPIVIEGNQLITGSRSENPNGQESGAASIYDITTGELTHRLIRFEAQENDRFGVDVAVHNGNIVVGAEKRFNDQPGRAYLYSIPQEVCQADFNNDGTLNFFDISAFLSAFAAGCP